MPADDTKPIDSAPSGLQAMGRALDPTKGDNIVQKVGPLILLLVYVALFFLQMFDLVPKPDVAQALLGVLGPVVGAILIQMGH